MPQLLPDIIISPNVFAFRNRPAANGVAPEPASKTFVGRVELERNP